MRVWFRWHRIGKLSIDDYFVLLALACFCAGLVPPQIMWDNGLGGDLSKLTAAQLEAIMKAIVPGTTIYVTTLWCIKFALVFFYRALAAPGSHMVIVYNAALVGLAITYIILFFHIMFHCYPQSRRWNLDPNKRCDQQAEDVNFWLLSLFNIISDLVIICLPITMVSRLQMSLRDKLAVIAMFALGFIVVIASCIRAYFAKREHPLLTATVSGIEASVALITVCLPAVRSLLLGRGAKSSNSASYDRQYELSQPRAQGDGTTNNASNMRNANHTASSSAVKLQSRHHATGSEDSLVSDESLQSAEVVVPGRAITVNTQIVTLSEDCKSDTQSTKVTSPFV